MTTQYERYLAVSGPESSLGRLTGSKDLPWLGILLATVALGAGLSTSSPATLCQPLQDQFMQDFRRLADQGTNYENSDGEITVKLLLHSGQFLLSEGPQELTRRDDSATSGSYMVSGRTLTLHFTNEGLPQFKQFLQMNEAQTADQLITVTPVNPNDFEPNNEMNDRPRFRLSSPDWEKRTAWPEAAQVSISRGLFGPLP